MNYEATNHSNVGETSPGAPQAAASPAKSAEQKVRPTPLQDLADHDAKRAAIVVKVRKQTTHGRMLVGDSFIKDAATDPKKEAYLRKLANEADDRDRVAIETACAALFRKAAAPKANPQAQD